MITTCRFGVAGWLLAPLLVSCGSTAAPEAAVLTMACRPAQLNSARYRVSEADDEHLPERTVCTVTAINVDAGDDVFVKVDGPAADAASLDKGLQVASAGWAAKGGCPGISPAGSSIEELAPPGTTNVPVTNQTVAEGQATLPFCFQCGEFERGVTAVSAELLSDPSVKATPVVVECFTRNPVNFACDIDADSPQVGLGRRVKLTVSASDDADGENVANNFIKVSSDQQGALTNGEGEDTEVRMVLVEHPDQPVAVPASEVTFTCPDEPDLYQVTVEFDDQQLNGTSSCTTFVNCTDNKEANFIRVTSTEPRLVADCTDETTITAVVTGPEGPVKGRESQIEVSMCANAGGVWQVDDADDTLSCADCCAACGEIFGDEQCSRVTLDVDDNGVASVDIRSGRHPGTLTVVAESNLATLPFVERNAEQFENGQLVVDGDVSVVQVGIGDIPFLSASPRILGTAGSGFNENAAVCFQVNDTVGNPFPAGVPVEFDIPNSAGEVQVEPTQVQTDGTGHACTTLIAGHVATTVSVRATVQFGSCPGQEAIEVQSVSTGIPIIGVKPSAGGFALDCSLANVGSFIRTDGINALVDQEFPCFTQLKDRFRNPVGLSTAISYRAEAGVIGGTVNTVPLETDGDPTAAQADVGKASVYYGTFGVLPKDVTAFREGQFQGTPAEPKRIVNGKEFSPRDGLVTIIAYVSGEEEFTDRNGNGEYDLGEPFVDLAEPFVDMDDDNLRDDDEQFIDINLPGHIQQEHDGPNGQWDANTIIWTETRIVASGRPSQVDASWETSCTSPLVGCGLGGESLRVDASDSCNIVAAVRDDRLNLVNCSTQYQWVVSGATLADSELATVDCIRTGILWEFILVPAGAGQPDVWRRRTIIRGWGEYVRTTVPDNANVPTDLTDLSLRSGRYFDASVLSTTAPPGPQEDPLPHLPLTIQLNLTYSTGPGGGTTWVNQTQWAGCAQ